MVLSAVLKVAGVLVGTIASFHTALCLVQPIDPNVSQTSGRLGDAEGETEFTLFNFTSPETDVERWVESSDTVRQPGKSKAAFVIQKTQLFQRAVFFALLNPQPNGAGFAGVRHPVKLDLSRFSAVEMKVRGQGESTHFKIVLKHHNEVGDASPSYEQFFTAPNEFDTVTLPLDNFKPYWRGQPLNETKTNPLDKSDITSFGIQYYGGVYEQIKQSGPASLEIDWIRAVM